MFANAELARAAAEKEIQEARARTAAQRELADAQAQAAQRTLVVAREKAGNEAKSLFMSLMMHEVCYCSHTSSHLHKNCVDMQRACNNGRGVVFLTYGVADGALGSDAFQ